MKPPAALVMDSFAHPEAESSWMKHTGFLYKKPYYGLVPICFGDGTVDGFRMRVPSGETAAKKFEYRPYIDDDEMLRIAVKDPSVAAKVQFPTKQDTMKGEDVKYYFPKLFAYAQKLGHWKGV